MQTSFPHMLQYLDTLLKHGNYTKAAKDLYISQPYLTQTIKKAEQDLGIQIINRQATPLQLTEAGKIYYHYLESLEAEQEKFQRKIAKYSSPDNTIIRIGILSSLGTYLLPLFLPKYIQQHPEVKIEINEELPERNETKVLNGELDFFISQNPETVSPKLNIHECGKQSYYAVIPKSSNLYVPDTHLLPQRSISVKELLANQLILTTRGSAIRRQIDYLFQKHKITPTIMVETSNIYTVAELAKHNLGIAIVPESVITENRNGDYNLYPISSELISLDYFIAYSTDKTLVPAEKELISSFLELSDRYELTKNCLDE